MYVETKGATGVRVVYTEGGQQRVRLAGAVEASIARLGGRIIAVDSPDVMPALIRESSTAPLGASAEEIAANVKVPAATLTLPAAQLDTLATKIAAKVGKLPTVTQIGAACVTAFRSFFIPTK